MGAVAISVDRVSKRFRIPHEHRTTIKEHFLHPRRKIEYETNFALSRVSLVIDEGEFFGIIGPNGSGKSTLLKIIAGIYRPNEGAVQVNGLLSPFIELGVGFNPELTARDNVHINGALLGLSRKEMRSRFTDIMRFAELERFVDQKLKNFSSGMQVRLAYSIAIQVEFDVLLLDEVLAVGDQSFQEKCHATFEQFHREGKTIVLVSHDLASVARFCDRTALIQGGTVMEVGSPDDVVATYLSHEQVRVE